MIEKLKTLANEKKSVHTLYLCYMYLTAKITSAYIEVKSVFRKFGLCTKSYSKLIELEGKYKGERCFIIATGPSLTIKDLELLKNEHTISMNSICMLYDETTWRPDYLGVQDDNVYKRIYPYLEKWGSNNVLISDEICKDKSKRKKWILFPYNGRYHAYEERFRNKYFTKFSEDCGRIVYDGYSITYSLVQIACYMGFKEIYLLGADCNYEKGKKNHIVECGFVDSSFEHVQERLFCGYKKAKEYADMHHIKVYNATRGGMLEIFPRISLDELILK